jgi:hypothetical protein
MPEPKKTQGEEPSPPNERDLLESFLSSVERFATEISAECTKAAPEGEQRTLIEGAGRSFVDQTNNLLKFVRETASRLTAAQRGEMDKFLQVQSGVALANRGVEVTKQLLARGVLGNLVHWIAKHLEELKKILSEILHFLFKLLHIPYPDWLDRILQIIDECFHLVLGLLADVFGIDLRLTARQLSEGEVDLLHKWAAFESVRAVRAGRELLAQDEK